MDQGSRRKPRKLEIRSQPNGKSRELQDRTSASNAGKIPKQGRKKPTKLKDKKASEIPEPTQADEAVKAAETAKSATLAQQKAAKLKKHAEHVSDPDQQNRLMSEAVRSQKKALAENETVKTLSKGTVQGASAGGGIGMATGAGVGTAVGTVVGVPTTALGAGVGAGVGALHGPFVTIADDDDDDDD